MRYFPKLAWSALFAIAVFCTVSVVRADEQEPPKADHKAKASAAAYLCQGQIITQCGKSRLKPLPLLQTSRRHGRL